MRLFWVKLKSFWFQNGPEFIIYKEHFLIHNRRPSNVQRKKSDEEKLSRKSSFSSVLENVGKPVTNLCMSDNFDPDQDKFQTALSSRKSTVESEKCWWRQSIEKIYLLISTHFFPCSLEFKKFALLIIIKSRKNTEIIGWCSG